LSDGPRSTQTKSLRLPPPPNPAKLRGPRRRPNRCANPGQDRREAPLNARNETGQGPPVTVSRARRCGHVQLEPRTAISTVCGKCQSHIDLQEDRRSWWSDQNPSPVPSGRSWRRERSFVFNACCLKIPATAESSMCKWCSTHIDLRIIASTGSLTELPHEGTFVIEEKGIFSTAKPLSVKL